MLRVLLFAWNRLLETAERVKGNLRSAPDKKGRIAAPSGALC